jgi:tetratricopeptide (TPR) repeat protein
MDTAARRLQALLDMLEREPDDVFLNYAAGLEYRSNGNIELAETQLKRTITLDPEHAPACYQLGQMYETLSQTAEALKWYNQGLEISRRKRDNKSVSEFEEAIFLLEE